MQKAICSHCNVFVESDKPLRCSKCKSAYYCNVDCQKKNFEYHKKFCTPQQKLDLNVPDTDINYQAIITDYLVKNRDSLKHMCRDAFTQVKRGMLHLSFNENGEHICTKYYTHRDAYTLMKDNGIESIDIFDKADYNYSFPLMVELDEKVKKDNVMCSIFYVQDPQ